MNDMIYITTKDQLGERQKPSHHICNYKFQVLLTVEMTKTIFIIDSTDF